MLSEDTMVLKIQNGTISDAGVSLCTTCTNATIAKGSGLAEELIYCSSLRSKLRFKVFKCSGYEDKRLPSLYEMQQLAWTLQTDRTKKIGFQSPAQRRKSGEDFD